MPAIPGGPPGAPTSRPSVEPAPHTYDLRDDIAPHEGRNFVVIALYQIVMRTGWIFKTESIIMPAVVDVITGGGPLGGMIRGCLPVLNRFGHSIPPMLFSRRLKVMPRKRTSMLLATLVMAGVFIGFGALWRATGESKPWWMWIAFLSGYTLFFIATGINNLSLGTLQGKLIHATRRGRLLTTANFVGAVVAIAAAWLLLTPWLTPTGGRFDLIFASTGLCFAAAAGCILLTIEPKDDYHEDGRGVGHLFRTAYRIVHRDHNFRRMALVGMAFGSSLALFPHYQALALSDRLGLDLSDMVWWVIVQNAGTAVFSLLIGPLADRRGNRVVLQFLMLGVAAMPAAAILLSHDDLWGAVLYPGVFFFIGLTPVGFKTLNNYTLEICPPQEHPRYLSTLSLCIALPLFLSPAVGYVVEATSFEVVFFAVCAVIFAGWLMTFRLEEPRRKMMAPVNLDTLMVEDE